MFLCTFHFYVLKYRTWVNELWRKNIFSSPLLSSCIADLVKIELPQEDQGNSTATGKQRRLQAVNVNRFTVKESLYELCLRTVTKPGCSSPGLRCKAESQAGSTLRLGKEHVKSNFKIVAGNSNGQDLSIFAQRGQAAHSPQIQGASSKEWVPGFRKQSGMSLWDRAVGPQEEAKGNSEP